MIFANENAAKVPDEKQQENISVGFYWLVWITLNEVVVVVWAEVPTE